METCAGRGGGVRRKGNEVGGGNKMGGELGEQWVKGDGEMI